MVFGFADIMGLISTDKISEQVLDGAINDSNESASYYSKMQKSQEFLHHGAQEQIKKALGNPRANFMPETEEKIKYTKFLTKWHQMQGQSERQKGRAGHAARCDRIDI